MEATDFDILLFGYAVDGGEVIVVDLAAREKIPVEILAALADENITKWAFNSNFERVCRNGSEEIILNILVLTVWTVILLVII